MNCKRCHRLADGTELCRYHRTALGMGYQPAEPVKRHLEKLLDLGWEKQQIAEAAGLPVPTVAAWSKRDYKRARHATYTAILSVPLMEKPGRRSVPAVGGVRRLHGLMRMGYTRLQVAELTGWSPRSLDKMCEKGHCSIGLHMALKRVADQLGHEPGPSKWAASIAKGRGYIPLWAWDEDNIDGPDAVPNLGEIEENRSNVIVSEARFLASYGASREEIARRLGVTVATLRTYLGRAA